VIIEIQMTLFIHMGEPMRPHSILFLTVVLLSLAVLSGCSKTDTKNNSDDPTTTDPSSGQLAIQPSATNIPKVTKAMTETIPAAYQTGGLAIASLLASKQLGDPAGAPPSAPSLMDAIWNQMESGSCTDAQLANGDCFKVRIGSAGTFLSFVRPPVLTHPDLCRDPDLTMNSETANALGGAAISRVCRLENALVRGGSVVDACYDKPGKEITLTDYIPFVADWGLPSKLKIQGSFKVHNDDSVYYFAVNPAVTSAAGQFIFSRSAYAGGSLELAHIDRTNKKFLTLIMSGGQGTSPSILGFSGDLPAVEDGTKVGSFEVVKIQYYTNGTPPVTFRLKSNGTHLWSQFWLSDYPGNIGFNASTAETFNNDMCLAFAANLPQSTYEDKSVCVAAFGKTTDSEVSDDMTYRLRLGVDSIKVSQWIDTIAKLDPEKYPIGTVNSCLE
jgi:hypothetical protein